MSHPVYVDKFPDGYSIELVQRFECKTSTFQFAVWWGGVVIFPYGRPWRVGLRSPKRRGLPDRSVTVNFSFTFDPIHPTRKVPLNDNHCTPTDFACKTSAVALRYRLYDTLRYTFLPSLYIFEFCDDVASPPKRFELRTTVEVEGRKFTSTRRVHFGSSLCATVRSGSPAPSSLSMLSFQAVPPLGAPVMLSFLVP